MQRRSCHFLAARPIASIGPAAKKEGRNERGGNRYVRPTATAPHLDSTEDGSLPAVGRATGIVKGFRTPAGHGRDEMRGGRRPKSLGGGNRGGCAPAIELTLEDLRRRAGMGGWCAGYRQSPFIWLSPRCD